jgi:sn-glycerol 3-phosphate transport system permease protein
VHLAAYAFARYVFPGKQVLFALVLVQLMVMPDILLVENYRTLSRVGLIDTLLGIGLPYFASAFAIFLLRQTFMGVPRELDEAARVEGASPLQTCGACTCRWRGRCTWPLRWCRSATTGTTSCGRWWSPTRSNSRPLTVGLQVFASTDQGIDWAIITAATLMTSAPLLVGFLLFQRQFVQSFMRAGIK